MPSRTVWSDPMSNPVPIIRRACARLRVSPSSSPWVSPCVCAGCCWDLCFPSPLRSCRPSRTRSGRIVVRTFCASTNARVPDPARRVCAFNPTQSRTRRVSSRTALPRRNELIVTASRRTCGLANEQCAMISRESPPRGHASALHTFASTRHAFEFANNTHRAFDLGWAT